VKRDILFVHRSTLVTIPKAVSSPNKARWFLYTLMQERLLITCTGRNILEHAQFKVMFLHVSHFKKWWMEAFGQRI
jgi:hypothetical protein